MDGTIVARQKVEKGEIGRDGVGGKGGRVSWTCEEEECGKRAVEEGQAEASIGVL